MATANTQALTGIQLTTLDRYWRAATTCPPARST